MSIENANNWRARRTQSIKLRTSDARVHPVKSEKSADAPDAAKRAAMQDARDSARADLVRRRQVALDAKRREAREARADIEHAMREESVAEDRKRKRQRPARPRQTEEERLSKSLERLREKFS